MTNAGRPPIYDTVKLDVILSLAENLQIYSRQISADRNISKSSVLCVLKTDNYNPYLSCQ